MAEPVRGESGAGTTTVYTTGRDLYYRLELLTFTIVTDGTAGVHTVRVRLVDPALSTIGVIPDLNEAAASGTYRYTFGIGLTASTCVITDGMAVTDALPDTVLRPETTVKVEPVDDTGAEIPGDQVGNVVLYLARVAGAASGGIIPAPAPLLVPVLTNV